jgi:hypothetical protein
MARQETIIIQDDIDGSGEAVRVVFAWAGTLYEIDLAPHNRAALGSVLGPFLDKARKLGRLPVISRDLRADARQVTTGQLRKADTERLAAIRAWANDVAGLSVGPRGQVAAVVQDWYADRDNLTDQQMDKIIEKGGNDLRPPIVAVPEPTFSEAPKPRARKKAVPRQMTHKA